MMCCTTVYDDLGIILGVFYVIYNNRSCHGLGFLNMGLQDYSLTLRSWFSEWDTCLNNQVE